MRKLLIESLPLGLMLAFNLVYFRVDTILLSFMKSSHDVGVYGFAYKFFDFLIAIPLFFSNALYPSFIEKTKNFRSAISNVRTYARFFIPFSIALVIAAWIAAPLLQLVKNDFADSILPFRLLVLSLPIFFLTSLFQWFLIAQKKQAFLLWTYALSAVINVVLNLTFIPSKSYLASAVITGLSETCVCIILFIKMRKVIKGL